jgi:hypothetical protein
MRVVDLFGLESGSAITVSMDSTKYLTVDFEYISSLMLRGNPDFDPAEVERRKLKKTKVESDDTFTASARHYSHHTLPQPVTTIREKKARQEYKFTALISLNGR